jgi:uncharacterized NAD(P)/FAD-binding protein YdhS
MTAVHLAAEGLDVHLFERSSEPARGIAYGTPERVHLLNVPAAKMSAFQDRPDHFRSALSLEDKAFAPRRDYGDYLGSILRSSAVKVFQSEVCGLEREKDGWRLALSEGTNFEADAVVLALGNEPPAVPDVWSALPVIANPWTEEARRATAALEGEDGEVLLIGTGLTMIDVVLSLEEAGFRGRILAFSRRGLLPQAHAFETPAPVDADELPRDGVLALWRWLRRRAAAVGVQAAVDSLRPHSAALWQGWSVEQRRRFLRHARPWWDVQRHRIAPEHARRLERLRGEGRLEVAAARLRGIADDRLILSGRKGEREVKPRLIVNCTGPLGNLRRTANPLLRALLDGGVVELDPLALGLLADAEDQVAPRLWALGALTKGMYWEMTAVPDIRAQAERVATAIVKELQQHG